MAAILTFRNDGNGRRCFLFRKLFLFAVACHILSPAYAFLPSLFSVSAVRHGQFLGCGTIRSAGTWRFRVQQSCSRNLRAAITNLNAGESTVSDADSIAERFRQLFKLNAAIAAEDYTSAAALQQDFAQKFGIIPAVGPLSLKNATVVVAGANGRVGSTVCKLLLRRGCKVTALVRNVDKVENYARLSHEIGAEEGIGSIEAPWVRKSVEFVGTEQMRGYGIGKLLILECDLLDEKSVNAAFSKGADAVIFCASDFDGGLPRISAPDLFTPEALFAVTDPIFLESAREANRRRAESTARRVAGQVDDVGVANVANAFKRQQMVSKMTGTFSQKATNLAPFVLLSSMDGALRNDVLPPGAVEAIKRRGEVRCAFRIHGRRRRMRPCEEDGA